MPAGPGAPATACSPRAPLGPLYDLADQLGGELLDLCARGASRDELFRALLRQVSGPGPVNVVVVEDIHWADEATMDLLRFAGRRLRDTRVLLIVTFRDDDLATDDQLRVALGELARHRTTRRIALAPLSADAVRALAGGSSLEAAALYQLTGARVQTGLLEATAGCPPAAVDELLACGLLAADGGRLRFRHEIARLAVEQAIPALASHREAVAQFERALRFASGAKPVTVAGLYDELAAELTLLDRAEESAEACKHALELWRAAGDRLREGDTTRRFSCSLWHLCRGEESHAAAAAAVALLEPLGPGAELARALVELASRSMVLGRHEAAIANARRPAVPDHPGGRPDGPPGRGHRLGVPRPGYGRRGPDRRTAVDRPGPAGPGRGMLAGRQGRRGRH